MVYTPNIDLNKFEYALELINTHTAGESTRIVVSGFPELKGNTMMEKKNYCQREYDYLRTALMGEPRGHRDMFGAILTEAINPEADIGVFFTDSKSYMNMCGHGTIGVCTTLVEAKMIDVIEPYTDVYLDTPSGLIHGRVLVEDGKAVEVSFVNVPSFLYKEDLSVNIDGIDYIYDIAFGGQFFIMVDANQINLPIEPVNERKYVNLGMKMIKKINEEIKIEHPFLPINDVGVLEFYYDVYDDEIDVKNIVVFGRAQSDRSPCGTGTSAKLALLYSQDMLQNGEGIINESFIGTRFKGEIVDELEYGEYNAILPEITGSGYITSVSTALIDPDDPLKHGFFI